MTTRQQHPPSLPAMHARTLTIALYAACLVPSGTARTALPPSLATGAGVEEATVTSSTSSHPAGGVGGNLGNRTATISNVAPRRDTAGNIVNAHAGGVYVYGGVYYLLGEHYKSCPHAGQPPTLT